MADKAKSTGGDGKGVYILTYFFTWLSGLIVFFTAGQNNRLKMHGAQAIILGVIAFILAFIPFVGSFIAFLIWLYGMYIGYMAYKGTDVMVPAIGDYAKKLAK